MNTKDIELLTNMINCYGIDSVVEKIAYIIEPNEIFTPDKNDANNKYYKKCSDILYISVEALKHANDDRFELVLIQHTTRR